MEQEDKHTDVVQWLIEQDILCYIHYLEEHLDLIAFSLLNILHWI